MGRAFEQRQPWIPTADGVAPLSRAMLAFATRSVAMLNAYHGGDRSGRHGGLQGSFLVPFLSFT